MRVRKKSRTFARQFEMKMKKIILFIALIAFSAMGFAASITATDVHFDAVSIEGKDNVEGEIGLPISWADLPLWSQVRVEVVNAPADHCLFTVDGYDNTYIWTGSGYDSDPFITSYDCIVGYLADAAGDYSCKIHIYVCDPDNTNDCVIVVEKTINVTLSVTNGVVTKTEEVNALTTTQKALRDGRLVIIRNGLIYTAEGQHL